MTEDEWDNAKEATSLLTFLRADEHARKIRLFGVACCLRVMRLMPNPRVRKALEIAARYAEGLEQPSILEQEASASWEATNGPFPDDELAHSGAYMFAAKAVAALCESDMLDISWVIENVYGASVCDPHDPEEEDEAQAHMLRDIFGNPFRPVSFSPEWRTTTAVAIAQGMYESRDFGPMPLLADALQDAGCEAPEIIDHCRGPGPHVRGCWVVDGVLDKV